MMLSIANAKGDVTTDRGFGDILGNSLPTQRRERAVAPLPAGAPAGVTLLARGAFQAMLAGQRQEREAEENRSPLTAGATVQKPEPEPRPSHAAIEFLKAFDANGHHKPGCARPGRRIATCRPHVPAWGVG